MASNPPRDLCRGFRECYNAVLNAVVANPVVAGLFMGIPTYFLLTALSMQGTIITFYPESIYIQNTVNSPFFTLLGFSVGAWLLELASIRWKLPNLMNICAFGHSAVGSWWLVNLTIIFFAGWQYIPFRLMFIVLLGFMAPAIIWHITGDVIRAYTQKLVYEIAQGRQALSQQTEQLGESKV